MHRMRERNRSTSPSGVLGVATRTYNEFFADSIPTVAGGITFFFLLAIFPAIACIVSLYGIIADQSIIAHDLALISDFLPGGAVTVLDAELHRLINQNPQHLNFAFFSSLLIAIWSSSGGYKALVEGLNVAYETTETRSFWRLTANALVFTVALIIFAVVAIYFSVWFPQVRSGKAAASTGFIISRWPLLFAFSVILMQVVYRFGANHREAQWRWISWGSLIATAIWLVGTHLFTWYVQNYGSYDRVYGSLGAAVGFLTWVWLSLVVLLLGAEINCELERRAGPYVVATS